MNTSSIDNGYWLYAGSCDAPESPRILTRTEKGQALTHLEMDVNLASLLHTVVTSSTEDEIAEQDTAFERTKPTREQEKAGLFATFSYAKVIHSGSEGEEVLVEYPPVKVKVQHTTDEIRYKLANEQIPGSFDIAENLNVTGSVNAAKDLRVAGTGSFDGDVYIVGNLYVNGVMFGNLSRQEYHPTEMSLDTYPEPARRVEPKKGVRSGTSKYYTQEEVDQMLQNLREELLREIHGPEEK